MNLAAMFPKGKSYANEVNAAKKLRLFLERYDQSDLNTIHWVTLQMENSDRWQNVVIMRHNCMIPAMHFAHAGICVTN